jgi:secreted trypsin-like serine protease
MKANWITAILTLTLTFGMIACSTGDVFDTENNLIAHDWPIINGTRVGMNAPYGAVISIHSNSRKGVSVSPFCSGTLITDQVVLTAGHCLAGKTASKIAIYVGNSSTEEYYAGTLTYDDFYMASEVLVHPNYNSAFITNDIALARLDRPVAASLASPVPALPWNLAFDGSAESLDFAGFGVDETGAFGIKLHVVGQLDHLQGDHQIYYYQSDSGPCSGDSGGPAFVTRNGTRYVGGITSYGDSNCTIYGVSTRADFFEGFINAFIGIAPEPVCGDASCDAGEDCANCPADCGPCGGGTCGDGVCNYPAETCEACPADCLITHPKKGVLACCGDNICSSRESSLQCPADCL